MTQRIHDIEADTSERAVRSLLGSQCPQWAELPLSYLRTSGTDNAMWRIRSPNGRDLVLRLPRIESAVAGMHNELALLPLLAKTELAAITHLPTVMHAGEPTDAFPHRWAVLNWIDGQDMWSARRELDPSTDALAADLAGAVRRIRSIDHVPAPQRQPGDRGGPLGPVLSSIDEWLDEPAWSAARLLDVEAVRRSAAESAEVVDQPVHRGFVHGDLIPGNLLAVNGRLAAIIDWGAGAYADPAQDLTPAWSVLDRRARRVFREHTETDDATWLRARAFALQQAVAGVLYYSPRRHPLADVMARTLARILDDEPTVGAARSGGNSNLFHFYFNKASIIQGQATMDLMF